MGMGTNWGSLHIIMGVPGVSFQVGVHGPRANVSIWGSLTTSRPTHDVCHLNDRNQMDPSGYGHKWNGSWKLISNGGPWRIFSNGGPRANVSIWVTHCELVELLSG